MGRIKNSKFWYGIVFTYSTLSLLIVINQIFNLKLLSFSLLENSYLYCILALYLSMSFLIYPVTEKGPNDHVPLYDIILFVITSCISLYFAYNGIIIISAGWEYNSPLIAAILSLILWALVLESVRRTCDIYLMLCCLFFSLYPLFADYMPWIFGGRSYDFLTTARLHVMSTTSILGIPLNVVANLLIGFMLFGVILQHTGGGEFFLNIAQSIFGTTKGGTANINILGSCLFGMVSGSTVSSVLTIGSMTIPAMKKSGFPSHYAAAIAACASSGGPLMPPVMGAAAFIMASFLNMPYWEICVGAFIPAILFYLGLFIQSYGFAAKTGMKGMDKKDLPSFKTTLKEGWYYLFILILLCYLLLTLHVEAWAPFYAGGALIFLSMIKKETRVTFTKFKGMIVASGVVLSQMTSILAAAGLIIGGLSVTGVALAFSRELVAAAGNSIFLILLIGASASFILGLGMSTTACYIFLAIVMAPSLTILGINPLAAHLFVFYWGALSEITPPTALCVAAASGIAEAPFMRSGWTAMRLGAVKYIVPFFFVYSPTLLLYGPIFEITYTCLFAIIGVIAIGCGFEGYLIGVGTVRSAAQRLLLIVGGILLAFPEIYTSLAGIFVVSVSVLIGLVVKKNQYRESAVV